MGMNELRPMPMAMAMSMPQRHVAGGKWVRTGGRLRKNMACRQALDSVTFARKAATMQRPEKLIVIAIERVSG